MRRIRFSIASGAVAVSLLALSAVAGHAGSLEPSHPQLAAYRATDGTEPVALVQLLQVKNRNATTRYVAATRESVEAAGGTRVYGGTLGRLEDGPSSFRFDVLVIDEFPTREVALRAYFSTEALRAEALSEQVVLAVKPRSRALPTATRWASGLVSVVAGIDTRDAPQPPIELLRESAGRPLSDREDAASQLFSGEDQYDTLSMLNLNAYREKAQYRETDALDEDAEVSGREAYGRYSENTFPHVLRRGGYIIWAADPELMLVGDADDDLAHPWQALMLVHYPDRLAIRHMLNDADYQSAFHHRTAGIEEAIVMPGTPWAEFDSKND